LKAVFVEIGTRVMKIFAGTANKIKIEAVFEIAADYEFLSAAEVEGVDVPSGVADQPKNLAETVGGAKNRARAAFLAGDAHPGDLGIGLEDGLMAVPESRTGLMNIGICAVYDGKDFCLGASAAFEYPPAAIELVKKGMDINQAFHSLGLTDNPLVGSAQGAIGILTHCRWDRKETAKQALTAALIQMENKNLYGR